MRKTNSGFTCMLVRPPAGYATGNKPNIKKGLYLLPQALPYLARVIERAGGVPIVLDLELNGWSLSAFLQSFAALSPDVVLFTSTTPSYCYCREMALGIRRASPHVPIVFGGPHATYQWQQILTNRVADIVVFREGELALTQLLDCLTHRSSLERCNGIAYIDSTGILRRTVASPDADCWHIFGIPGYKYVDMRAYRERVGKCTLEVVRGCPHGCRFCLNTKYYLSPRHKPLADVTKELELLIGHYGFEKISVISPELVSADEYTSNLLQRFASILQGTNVTWACATTAMSLSPKILTMMAKANCRSIFIGIESGADEVQCTMGNKLRLASLHQRLLAIGEAGIGILASFIIGLPGETEASAAQTIELAHTLKDKYAFVKTIQFNTFGPFPGTDFAEEASRFGLRILPVDFAYYPVVPALESDTFPREMHYRLWHRVWQEFFPNYYEEYLSIEAAALAGLNPRLTAFCAG
jgi:anaerobic magnesium-protoporphyrin IX monomethyl ester cyclase